MAVRTVEFLTFISHSSPLPPRNIRKNFKNNFSYLNSNFFSTFSAWLQVYLKWNKVWYSWTVFFFFFIQKLLPPKLFPASRPPVLKYFRFALPAFCPREFNTVSIRTHDALKFLVLNCRFLKKNTSNFYLLLLFF